MALRTVSRLGLDTTLRAARLPLDLTTRALGGSDSGIALAVERADARVRSFAGFVLGDPDLQEDARRRHAATDERVRALRLRERAEDVEDEADQRVAEREQRARRRRADAGGRAEQRQENAATRRKQREEQAAQSAQARKTNVARTKQRSQQRTEERADEARLAALEEKAEALEEREDALVAADEAQRLARAAGKEKSRRKRGSNGAG